MSLNLFQNSQNWLIEHSLNIFFQETHEGLFWIIDFNLNSKPCKLNSRVTEFYIFLFKLNENYFSKTTAIFLSNLNWLSFYNI